MDRRRIIAAFQRIEAEAGGIAEADTKECVRLAAEECGVSYADALAALLDSPLFAGMMGRG